MKRSGSWLVYCLIFLMWGLSLPSVSSARGRIAGLRISNPSVVGTTLSFDVTLSVSPSTNSPELGFLGDHYQESSTTTWMSTRTTTNSFTTLTTYPCSTFTNTHHETCTGPPPTSSTYPCSTTTYTTHDTCTGTTVITTVNTLTYFYTTIHTRDRTILNPLLPAVDWGDGNTVPRTTLSQISSGTPRVYRGSFSHSFASSGGYTVRVGAFGKNIAPTLNGGNTFTVNVPESFRSHIHDYTAHESSGVLVSSSSDSSTYTNASPAHLPVGVTATASFGVPVELQSFTVAEASKNIGKAHHATPLAVVGLGFGMVLTMFGFVLLKRE